MNRKISLKPLPPELRGAPPIEIAPKVMADPPPVMISAKKMHRLQRALYTVLYDFCITKQSLGRAVGFSEAQFTKLTNYRSEDSFNFTEEQVKRLADALKLTVPELYALADYPCMDTSAQARIRDHFESFRAPDSDLKFNPGIVRTKPPRPPKL